MMLVARTRVGRWGRAITAVMLVATLACTGNGAEPEPEGVAGSESPDTGAESAAVAVTDPDQRIALERHLGHHAMLMIDAMRATADGTRRRNDRRQVDERRRTLRRNSDQVIAALEDVLNAGTIDGWVPRIEALLDIAGGGDGEEALAAAQAEYGTAVADAVATLSAEEATAQVAELDTHLQQQIDSYRDGDLAAAYAAEREAFSTAFRLGQQLVVAAGAAPEVTAGAAELRSALNQLLAEHTWLAVQTARRAVRGARDARHPSAALNGNTEDLTAALLSIYDEQEAVQFDEQWRDAIAALLRFTAAATELDDEARRTAARDLRRASRRIGDQLSAMTDSTIDQADARQAVTRHFRRLQRHSAALADNRLRRALDAADEAYADSSALADLIATGIAEHRAGEFPEQ